MTIEEKTFKEKLELCKIDTNEYIKIARVYAEKNGYDPALLKFSDNKKFKLDYDGVNFGANNYGDYIFYTLLGDGHDAKKKRDAYLKRSEKVKGEWRDNKKSKNNLARYMLWDA